MSRPPKVIRCPFCGTLFRSHGQDAIHCRDCHRIVVAKPKRPVSPAKIAAPTTGAGASIVGLLLEPRPGSPNGLRRVLYAAALVALGIGCYVLICCLPASA